MSEQHVVRFLLIKKKKKEGMKKKKKNFIIINNKINPKRMIVSQLYLIQTYMPPRTGGKTN